MDRPFDRFTAGFGLPSWRRALTTQPDLGFQSSFVPAPGIDIAEDANAYTITAELPGVSEKDTDITMSKAC